MTDTPDNITPDTSTEGDIPPNSVATNITPTTFTAPVDASTDTNSQENQSNSTSDNSNSSTNENSTPSEEGKSVEENIEAKIDPIKEDKPVENKDEHIEESTDAQVEPVEESVEEHVDNRVIWAEPTVEENITPPEEKVVEATVTGEVYSTSWKGTASLTD